MEKKKILHLITGLDIGGAEMMLLKTLPRMQDSFDNRVCCIMGRGIMGQKLEAAGVPVYYLDLKNIFDFLVILRFKKVLQEFRPDILVTYLIHADLFGRIFGRIFGVKKIICSVRVKLIQAKYIPLLFLDALTFPFVDHYHFNSQTTADMYHSLFFLPKRKITVIPNGIELEKYDISIDKGAKREELGLAKDKIIIGCVAKLRKQKGHKYLIEAFAEIARKRNDAILILVGDGAEKSNIENQINKLKIKDKVVLLGNRNDIPEILQVIDIFVLPTLFEGMSNAVLEAMAGGKPIIATNIQENRELIRNGESGILFSTKNIRELSKILATLMENDSKRDLIARNAKDVAFSKYAINIITDSMTNFLKSI